MGIITNEYDEVMKMHKYALTHCKDGNWYTYLQFPNKQRKLVKRKTEESLKKAIFEHYNKIDIERMKDELEHPKELNIYGIVPARYLISPFGDIYDNILKINVEQYICGQHGNYRGHKHVKLATINGNQDFDVAKLVMCVYNSMPSDDIDNVTIDHINLDSLDNYYRNLRWLERDNNASIRNNRQVGENNSQAILTRDQVQHICNLMVGTDLNNEQIAQMYGVSRWTISDIRNKRTWRHVSMFFELKPFD